MTLSPDVLLAGFSGGKAVLASPGELATAMKLPTTDEVAYLSLVASTALDQIEALGDDGVLTATEKAVRLIPLDRELEATWATMDARAAAAAGDADVAVERQIASASRAAWIAYRNSLVPAWNDVTANTAIDRAIFDARVEDYRRCLNRLSDALILTVSQADIDAITSDNLLSHGSEKSKLIVDYTALYNDFAALDSRFQTIGSPSDVAASRNSAYTQQQALDALLLSYSPAWDDVSTDTPIDGAQLRLAWAQAAQAISTFAAAISHGATIGIDLKAPDGSVIDPATLLNPALALSADGTLTATIGGVAQSLGKLRLPDMNAASDTARRQLEADLATLSAAIAQLSAGQSIVQNVFRDAGLYTDPASGITKLFAIESRADQISKLSVSLNAALATISLKADVNYVNQQILSAQLGGSSADLSSLLVRLTSAETNISGLQASVLLKADATVVTGLQGTVSAVQTSLDALTATVATKAAQTVVDAQGARLTLAEQTLSAFDGASIAQTVTASRRSAGDSDVTGANTILGALAAAQNARAADAATAQARSELGARINGASDAVASLFLALGVQIGAVSASVAGEQAARVAGDQAISSSLASYIAGNGTAIASINTALAAQATTTSALSGTITTLSTTIAGHTTTLTTYGQSINGLLAKWGVEFNSDGHVTGFALNNGSARTDAIFVVDTFKIVQPGSGSPVVPFAIGTDSVVRMHAVEVDTIKVGAVDVNELAQGAAQRAMFCSTTSDLAIPDGATANVVTITFTKHDSDSVLEVLFFANLASGDDLIFSGQFLLDGAVAQTCDANLIFDNFNSQAHMPITPFAFLSGVAAGDHTIAFNITNHETDSGGLTVRSNSTLKIVELRKGSAGTATAFSGGVLTGGGTGGTGGGGGGGGGGGVRIP